MDPFPRRSDANQKFDDNYKELFGDAPETIRNRESDVHTESAFNFGHEFGFEAMEKGNSRFDNSPAKRLNSDEIDFDPYEEENDPLTEGSSALESAIPGQSKKRREPDQLDEIIQKLQIMTVAYGFPEPGNLRSKNKKEIKKTIKCFSAILQQRELDMRFRRTVGDKFRKVETELNSEQRKNQTLVDKINKLEREVATKKNQITTAKDKMKDNDTKKKMDLVQTKKTANDLKRKVELMQKELKRKDRIIEKANEKMRNIIDK